MALKVQPAERSLGLVIRQAAASIAPVAEAQPVASEGAAKERMEVALDGGSRRRKSPAEPALFLS